MDKNIMEKNDKKLSERFKRVLIKDDGRSLKWFFENKIEPITDLTYSGLAQQLNGYAKISETVRSEVVKYLLGE